MFSLTQRPRAKSMGLSLQYGLRHLRAPPPIFTGKVPNLAIDFRPQSSLSRPRLESEQCM